MLEAEGVHLFGRWANKGNAAGFTALHKVRVFTEKTVTGVHGFYAMFFHECKQLILIQIGILGIAFP